LACTKPQVLFFEEPVYKLWIVANLDFTFESMQLLFVEETERLSLREQSSLYSDSKIPFEKNDNISRRAVLCVTKYVL